VDEKQQLEGLARRLLKATEQGKIQRGETAGEESFRVVLKSGAVRIDRSVCADDDSLSYALVVLNGKARETDRYSPTDIDGQKVLTSLWEFARRSARKSDKVIGSLLDELGNLEER